MTKLFRYNLLAGWERNLNPSLKVASMAAGYSRDTGNPAHFAARLFFYNEGHLRRWITDCHLRTIGGHVTPLLVRNSESNSQSVVRYSLDMTLVSKSEDRKINIKALDRYKRLMKAIQDTGYKIDWQKLDDLPRLYGSLQEFEEAINVRTIQTTSATAE